MLRIDSMVAHYAVENNVEQALVHAIIQTESAGNPWSIRYEPNMKWVSLEDAGRFAKDLHISLDTELMCQRTSWGLMQVMGVVARELDWSEELTKLLEPEIRIMYGCKQLRRIKEWNKSYSFDDVIAAYNAGSARVTSAGHYQNQAYVDKVKAYYNNYLKVGFT
jgi:soluble lytic murein transglycosylase-like protein